MKAIINGVLRDLTPEEETAFEATRGSSADDSVSKLWLVRAMREVEGLWPAVRAAIAADETLSEDWANAHYISPRDPLVLAMPALLALEPEEGTVLLQQVFTRAQELQDD